MEQIKIFDTTLRDGEQSPGCSMNLKEKIEIAQKLEKMKVDIIEAGFAISSPGDFESVQTIARSVKDITVASLARALEKDIDAAWEAVREAVSPRIHLFIATSPLHMEYKLQMTPEEVLAKTAYMTAYAKKYCPDIEFSAEDASRSDPDFLCRVVETAIANGATTVNIPDTVGYSTPTEMKNLIQYLRNNVANADKAIFSVHCHNDLGLATANSLAGVLGGARQVECTVNGLGERAGNTSLEEVVMGIRTRPDLFGDLNTGIDTTQIYRTSKIVYNIIGQTAPLNKPIVGKNAFAHESGIHQHGVLANKKTYEILTPESIGMTVNNIVLGKHSGKHAFESRLKEMGYILEADELQHCFDEFKNLCDKKKNVSDEDIEAIIMHHSYIQSEEQTGYVLDRFAAHSSNFTTATCTVSLTLGDEKFENVSLGDGPVDAAFKTIDGIINPPENTLDTYDIHSVSEGKDTLGKVTVRLRHKDRAYMGVGLSTDILEASIKAYINAMNRMLNALKEA